MTGLAATADRLIAAKGQTVTLMRSSPAGYDPAYGAINATTTQIGKGVILPLGAGLEKMPATNIPATDRQCLLSAVGIAPPKVDDRLTDATGKVWTVTGVATLAPAGEALLHELTIRGNA